MRHTQITNLTKGYGGACLRATQRLSNKYGRWPIFFLHSTLVTACLAGHLTAQVLPASAQVTTRPASAQAPASRPIVSGGLTLDDLASAQRQKLVADLGRAVTSKESVPEDTNAHSAKKIRPDKPQDTSGGSRTQTLVLVATYGTPAQPRAEVQINGSTRVVSPETALGFVTVEAIHHGLVRVRVGHQKKTMTYSLQPGERLDFTP